jgi:hypothetical protein
MQLRPESLLVLRALCLQSVGTKVDDPPMKVRGLGAAAVAAVSMIGLLASPAGAATSQGCSGSISSVDSQGAPLEKISVPGPRGSNADPFQLYWGLPLTWTGESTQAVTSGTWRVRVQHPSWLFGLGELVLGHTDGLAGTFDSGQGGTSFANSFTPSSVEPVALPGKYDVDFTVTGRGGVDCTVAMSVRVMDSPLRNPLWWLAFLLILAGLVMLLVLGLSKLTRPEYVRTSEQEGGR